MVSMNAVADIAAITRPSHPLRLLPSAPPASTGAAVALVTNMDVKKDWNPSGSRRPHRCK